MNLKTSIAILFILAGLFVLFPAPKNTACAGATGGGASVPIASQTCDTQVWKTMESRARLETEREIMQNQNLIFKADSILNYTCFDSFAAHAAQNIGPLFTHTTYFNNTQIIAWGNPNGMDYALDEVIIKSMDPYIKTNFDHEYLGGRGKYLGLGMPVVNHIPPQGDQYQCDVMAQVWKIAKCLNFVHNQNFSTTDGFYPFINLKGMNGDPDVAGYEDPSINDTRQFPTACTGKPFYASDWQDMYRQSRNETGFGANDRFYQYGTPLRNTYQAVRLLVQPSTAGCGAAIPTGVQVILGPNAAGSKYMDGVCTNPGCSYKQGSASAVGTCS